MNGSSGYVRYCGREIHYLEWGAPDAPPIVAWHGLARNAWDFEPLGTALADRFRVIAPDTIGRGLSQWSDAPEAEYALAFYVGLARELLDTLKIFRAGWIGTSMGGLVGIAAAATLLRERVSTLVLNDITPARPDPGGLARIGAYLAAPPAFATVTEYEAYLRQIYGLAGPRSDEAWRRCAERSLRRLPDGRITVHYDPAIAIPLQNLEDVGDLWAAYDTLTMPTVLLRAGNSDVASAESAQMMTGRGPRATVAELPGIGHAPWLESPEQIELVRLNFA